MKVLNDPNTTYTSLYSETPITQATRNGFTWGGLCDQIDSADVISVTHTTWNLIAVPFLQRLGTLTADSTYTTLASTVLAFGDTVDSWVLVGALVILAATIYSAKMEQAATVQAAE